MRQRIKSLLKGSLSAPNLSYCVKIIMFPLCSIDIMSRLVIEFFPYFPLYLVPLAIITFPTLGYLDQIRLLIMRKNPEIYSMNTALILILSSFIKISFYVVEPFDYRLLGQAICLFVVGLIHTYFHFYYRNRTKQNPTLIFNSERSFSNFFSINNLIKKFNVYNSTDFLQFLFSISLYFIIITGLFSMGVFLINSHFSVYIMSIVASVIDSFVSVPTFKRVVIYGDISTTSSVLVLQYVLGDIFKIIIFHFTRAPFAFTVGASFQLLLDLTLSIRYLYIYLTHVDAEITPKKIEKVSVE